MRSAIFVTALVIGPTPAVAGELDVSLGAQATTTSWPDDAGGGATLGLGYWPRSWIGVKFVGKEQYITVDDRFGSYFSFNAAFRGELGRFVLGGTLGLVHQHEQTRAAIEAQPFASLMGVADGTRHRMGSRAGASLALPFSPHARGTWYVALDIDTTAFTDDDRGPRFMTSAGLAVGFTYGAGFRK